MYIQAVVLSARNKQRRGEGKLTASGWQAAPQPLRGPRRRRAKSRRDFGGAAPASSTFPFSLFLAYACSAQNHHYGENYGKEQTLAKVVT